MVDNSAEHVEESPIIKKLHRQIEKARIILLKEPRKGQFQVKSWIISIRGQLKKLYGSPSEALDLFPQIKDRPPPDFLANALRKRLAQIESFVQSLEMLPSKVLCESQVKKVFIGHGRSPLWRELKDFLSERLGLAWDEFNRESVAGIPTWERLTRMLDDASFAFLVMTAEDEHADTTLHARENVIHECGLFQGRLGSRKAIILLEEGCKEFSNIVGLTHLPFPKGKISALFEEIRRVLEREKILYT